MDWRIYLDMLFWPDNHTMHFFFQYMVGVLTLDLPWRNDTQLWNSCSQGQVYAHTYKHAQQTHEEK